MTAPADARARARIEHYDFGIEVFWHPAIRRRFADRLPEIARLILAHGRALGTAEIRERTFVFEGETIGFSSCWDYDLEIMVAFADIAVFREAHLPCQTRLQRGGGPATGPVSELGPPS